MGTKKKSKKIITRFIQELFQFYIFLKNYLPQALTVLFGLSIIFYAFFSDNFQFYSYINKLLHPRGIYNTPTLITTFTPSPTPTINSTPIPTQTLSDTNNSGQTIRSVKDLVSFISPSLIFLIVHQTLHKSFSHSDICNINSPHLIRPGNFKVSKQVRAYILSMIPFTQIRFGVKSINPHNSHHSPDFLFVYRYTMVTS